MNSCTCIKFRYSKCPRYTCESRIGECKKHSFIYKHSQEKVHTFTCSQLRQIMSFTLTDKMLNTVFFKNAYNGKLTHTPATLHDVVVREFQMTWELPEENAILIFSFYDVKFIDVGRFRIEKYDKKTGKLLFINIRVFSRETIIKACNEFLSPLMKEEDFTFSNNKKFLCEECREVVENIFDYVRNDPYGIYDCDVYKKFTSERVDREIIENLLVLSGLFELNPTRIVRNDGTIITVNTVRAIEEYYPFY